MALSPSASDLLPETLMRLTKSALAKVRFPEGKTEHIVYDDDVSGFGVRMHPGGRKTWFLQYRFGSKQRRVSFGTSDALDPEEARKRARDMLAKVQLGVDPQSDRTIAKAEAALTFGKAVPRYLAYAEGRQRERHHASTKAYFARHWAPFADLSLSSIKRVDVAARLLEIAPDNGKFAANRARAALSAFFTWAIGAGIAEVNPVIGTHKATEEVKRDRVLTDDELRLVWTCAGPGDFGAIVRLLILTAARREEIGGAAWTEFNGDTLRIAAERSKNGKAHDIPLGATALAIVNAIERREGRDLIFGSGTGPFAGWSKCKAALDARMVAAMQEQQGPKAKLVPWRLHDLRRTAATRMADLTVPPHVIEALLNHISGSKAGVAGIYNRALYLPERRAALALWVDHVAKLAGGAL